MISVDIYQTKEMLNFEEMTIRGFGRPITIIDKEKIKLMKEFINFIVDKGVKNE